MENVCKLSILPIESVSIIELHQKTKVQNIDFVLGFVSF